MIWPSVCGGGPGSLHSQSASGGAQPQGKRSEAGEEVCVKRREMQLWRLVLLEVQT